MTAPARRLSRLLDALRARLRRFRGPTVERSPDIVERLLTMEREIEANTGFWTMAVRAKTADAWRRDLIEAADELALGRGSE